MNGLLTIIEGTLTSLCSKHEARTAVAATATSTSRSRRCRIILGRRGLGSGGRLRGGSGLVVILFVVVLVIILVFVLVIVLVVVLGGVWSNIYGGGGRCRDSNNGAIIAGPAPPGDGALARCDKRQVGGRRRGAYLKGATVVNTTGDVRGREGGGRCGEGKEENQALEVGGHGERGREGETCRSG